MAVWCVYIAQTPENSVSAIMRVFFDNANCVELCSLENKYSLLWSTLNSLKTIKLKTPMYKWHSQISHTVTNQAYKPGKYLKHKKLETRYERRFYLRSSTSIIGNEMTLLELKQLENTIL